MRKLNLEINKKNYILEMNRDSIKWLEENGFYIDDFYKKPVTYYELIWMSLFVANHREVNPSLAIKLMESYENEGKKPASVVKFGIEEYKNFINALTDIDSTASEEELTIVEN